MITLKIQVGERQVSEYQEGGIPFGLGYGIALNRTRQNSKVINEKKQQNSLARQKGNPLDMISDTEQTSYPFLLATTRPPFLVSLAITHHPKLAQRG